MGLFKTSRIEVSAEIHIEIEVDMQEKMASMEIQDPQGNGFYLDVDDIDNLIKSLQEAKRLIK